MRAQTCARLVNNNSDFDQVQSFPNAGVPYAPPGLHTSAAETPQAHQCVTDAEWEACGAVNDFQTDCGHAAAGSAAPT